MADGKRTVIVRTKWRAEHRVEISDKEPPLASDDITTVLSYDELSASNVEMYDWEVIDNGTN